jgi:peptide/nickel transport system permease protein
VGTILTWTLSFPIGIRSALFRGGFYDRSATFFSYLLISIPGFFFAYLLIIFVVTRFHVPVIGMETFGIGDASMPRWVMDRVWHLLIPSVLGATAGIAVLSRYVRGQMLEVEGHWHLLIPSVLGATAGIAVLSRYVRGQMLEVEGQDYVRTARAKGLPEEQVHYKHALRNALLPFVTMFGLILPGLIGGSVIIESIFSWPNFISAVLVLIGTFISDVLYMVVDPRIRL